MRVNTEMFREKAHHRVLLHVDFLLLVAVAEHLIRTVNQHDSEDNQHPIEAVDDGSSGKDKDKSQHDGAQNAPVQHVLILCVLDAEGSEYHHHHKEIVYGKRFFYQVTGDIGNGHIMAITL